MALSASALSFLYPQVPIEDKQDVELLWSDELEHKTLLKKKYINDFTTFNAKHGRTEKESHLKELQKQTYYKDLKTHYLMERFDTFDAISGETVFYETFPEFFGYMVLGRKFLAAQSKSRKFSFFTDFQVDYQRTFIDPSVIRMGKVTNRGGAKSWLDMFCSVMDCTIHPWNEISIMGGSAKQSVGAYDYARAMVEAGDCGVHHLVNQKEVVNDHIHFKPRNLFGQLDDNGYTAKIFNQASAETSTRGPRASKIIFDEVTQTKEDVIQSTIGQAITSPDIKIIWGGTPDDPGHMAHTDWWCNPPDNVVEIGGVRHKCHHWIYLYEPDPELSWHLFHWDAYDCHVDKGGWMYDRTIRAIKKLYKSLYKRRRELFAEWTSESGTILDINDIQLASSKSMREFPKRIEDYNGVIISVDGARHAHYATILMTGWRLGKAHVLYAKGWQHIKGKDLENYIMAQVAYCLDHHVKPIVIIEEAPVSVELIDNIREKCTRLAVFCDTSTFKHKKNKMVEHVCGYFETGMIQIPAEFIQVINECMMWRWADTVDSEGHKVPVKGNDDFIDNLSHALYNDYRLKDKGQDKQHAGAAHDESKMSETLRVFKTGGYNPNSFNREW